MVIFKYSIMDLKHITYVVYQPFKINWLNHKWDGGKADRTNNFIFNTKAIYNNNCSLNHNIKIMNTLFKKKCFHIYDRLTWMSQ